MSYTSSEICFIKARVNELAESFSAWQEKIFSSLGWSIGISSGCHDWMETLNLLLPRVAPHATKHFFLQCDNGWTAYFDNAKNGTDSSSVLSVLCRKEKVVGVRAVLAEKSYSLADRPAFLAQEAAYPARIVEYCDGKDGSTRVLVSANDGGRWKHLQYGNPLPSETIGDRDVSKKSPLTVVRANRFLEGIGIYIFDESWYGPEWALVQKDKLSEIPTGEGNR